MGLELIRHFTHKCLARRQDTVFRLPGKAADFLPIHRDLPFQRQRSQYLGTRARGRMVLGINGYQYTFNEQLLRLHDLNNAIGAFEFAQWCAGQALQDAKQIDKQTGYLPTPWPALRAQLAHNLLALSKRQSRWRQAAEIQIARCVSAVGKQLNRRASYDYQLYPALSEER